MTREVLLGYVSVLSFAMMSRASRKHKSVAMNTTEAEYIAGCDACIEAMWLHKLVSEPRSIRC
jgi:hypothetical protein